MQHILTLTFIILSQTAVAQIATDYHRTALKGKVKRVHVKNYSSELELAEDEPFVSYWAEYDALGNDTNVVHFMNYAGRPERVGRVRKVYDGAEIRSIQVYDIKNGKHESLKKTIRPTYDNGKLIHEQHLSGTVQKLTATVEYLETKEENGIRSGKYVKREEENGVWSESKGTFKRDSIGILSSLLLSNVGDTLLSIEQKYHTKTGYSYLEKRNGIYGKMLSLTKSEITFDAQGNVSKIRDERKDLLTGKISVYNTHIDYQYEGEADLPAPDAVAPQDFVSLMTDGSFWYNAEHQLFLYFQKTTGHHGAWYSKFLGEEPNSNNWIGPFQKYSTGTWRYQDIAYSKLFKIRCGNMGVSLNPPKLSGDTLFLETSGRDRERVFFLRTEEGFDVPPMVEEEKVELEAVPQKAHPASGTSDPILSYAEEPAEFVGGKEAMQAFIKKNLQYPKHGLNGTVVVRFVVRKDGSIDEPTILRSMGSAYDDEVLRVVRSFPKFKAAKQRGEAVDMYFSLPVRFAM